MKQAASCNAWALGFGKEIKMDYQTNTDTEVKYYRAVADWSEPLKLYATTISNPSNYPANQLYKTITYDENTTVSNSSTTALSSNNGATIEFKDKEVRVVLKRTFNVGIAHDTYYVYDQYGNLTFVLPPLSEGNISPSILNNLCYQYKYDYRNRLVEKKLPGKQWEFIVYDKLDRVVATVPANAPFQDLIDQDKTGWMVTKYDVFNRPVYTAWEMANTAITPTERTIRQSNNNSAAIINETKVSNNTIDGKAMSYSNSVAPTTLKILTVNYFPASPSIR